MINSDASGFARMRRAPGWQLGLVTIAIVASFFAATLYAQHTSARIDQDAASIAGKASPSIEALSAARGEMLHAEVAVAHALEENGGRIDGENDAAEAALRRMRAHQADYLTFPFYPGEREHWSQVDDATHAFEELIAACFAAMKAGRLDDARELLTARLRPATEQLDGLLGFLVNFNAAQQHRLGVEIPRLRHHAARIALLLDGISALLAALLIALVLRESRRRQALQQHFSERLEAITRSTLRISRALFHGADALPMLRAIVEESARLVDADFGALGFGGSPDQPFGQFVFHGMSPAEAQAIGRYPRPVGVLGKVIAEARTLRVADVTKDPSFGGLPAGHPALGPFLGVPVGGGERGTCGNLYLARRPRRAPFDEEDEYVIRLLAAQAAVSAENARLYHSLEEQRTRAQLLADASARMVGSLDYEATLERAAHAVLPAFADLCILHLADENGTLARMVMASADAKWQLLFNQIAPKYGRPSERHPAVEALRSRRALRFAVDDALIDRIAQSEEHRSLIEQEALRHAVWVPVLGRARVLGVLAFHRMRDVAFGDDDVAFAEELARRTALSLENTILFERTRRAVQARDDVLALVSHDLRNPLSSIRMVADALQRDRAIDDARRRELATRILRTTDRMTRLIEDLLDASKIEVGTFAVEAKPESVSAILDDAIELFRDAAATKSIALTAEVAPGIAGVRCDRDRVLQVLSNLIGNALKFTPADGAITITADPLGEEVRFCVSDSGPGISEAERQHIFDRYWQAAHARRSGAGLGLFIVKGIVEAHGGRVCAESAPGGGARLCFTLPAMSLPLDELRPTT